MFTIELTYMFCALILHALFKKTNQSFFCHLLFFIAMVAIKGPNCKLYQGLPYLPKLSKKNAEKFDVCVYAALDVFLPHKYFAPRGGVTD